MSGGIPTSTLLPYKLLSGNLSTQIPNGGWYLQPTLHCTHTMFSYSHFLYKGDLARLWITLTILGSYSSYCHVELSPSAICALHFKCKSPHNIMTSPGTIVETSMEIYRAHPLIRTDIWIQVWRPLNDKSGLAYCCMLHTQPADNSFCSNWCPYLCCSQDWWGLMHWDSSKSTVWWSG